MGDSAPSGCLPLLFLKGCTMFYLAWRNVARRLGQSFVTTAIVAVTTFSLVASCVVAVAFGNGIALSKERLGADIMVLPSGASSDASEVLFTAQPVNVYLSEDVLDAISGVQGVLAITPQFFTQTVNQSCCSVVGISRVVGIDMSSDFVVKPWIESGSEASIAGDQILLGSSAPQIEGGQASILGSTFHVAGTLAETGTSVDETIFMDIDSARQIAAESPYLEGVWDGVDPFSSVSCVMVKVVDGSDLQMVADSIVETCPGTVAIVTSDVVSGVSSQFAVVEAICAAFLIVIVAVSALALGGRFSALVSSRSKELGLLRTMGAGVKGAIGSVVAEAGIMGGVGWAAGSVAGCITAYFVVGWMRDALALPGAATGAVSFAGALLIGALIVVTLCVVSLTYPLLRIAKNDPQKTLSRGDL